MEKEKLTRAEYYKQWAKNNPEKIAANRKKYQDKPENKEAAKSKRRTKIYGIDEEKFLDLKFIQNNRCAICRKKSTNSKRSELDIDHCHKTGTIRGLLCNNCNRGIGHLQDDPELLLRAFKYLENYNKGKNDSK